MCSSWSEALASAIAALAAEDLDDAPDAALADELVALRRRLDGLETAWLRRVEAFDRRGGATVAGAVSSAGWLRSACRLSPGVARARVELARALPGLPDTAAALSAGDISVGHAQQVATAVAELAEAIGAQAAAEVEPALVDVARAVDPARLRRELVHARHALAPEAAASAAERAYDRRGLSASETLDGMVAVDGILDPEGGALLLAALMPMSAPADPDDRRTPRQRRADALVELARQRLDRGDLPALGGERPHLTVLVPLETLQHRIPTPPNDPTQPGQGAATAATHPTRQPAGNHDTQPAGTQPTETTTKAATHPTRQPAGNHVTRPTVTRPTVTRPTVTRPTVTRPTVTQTTDTQTTDTQTTDTQTTDTQTTDTQTTRSATYSARQSAVDPPAAHTAAGNSGPPGQTTAATAARPTRRPVGGARAADTGWAGPITGEAARRLACDAGITRVITDGASQPLDVGRRTRTIPPALRAALVVRDRGCAFPGCDRPPPWTDAHHLVSWIDGGRTALDNVILLCRRHHRVVHEGRWQLTRGPDGTWTATPPGRLPAPARAA